MKKFLFIIFILVLSLSFSFAKAQLQESLDNVEISMSPANPSEGQLVKVSLESYFENLDVASIVWTVDGKNENHGVGTKEIELKAPKTGKTLTVIAIIKTSTGKEIKKIILVRSGSVDIIFESRGYVPPFYKGKNYLSYQNYIRLVAVPHLSSNGSSELNPKDLVYTWKQGGKYIEGGRGYGKQSVDIKADDIPKPLEISVEVYSRDQKQFAFGTLDISPTEPSVLFYEMSPLYGTFFNKAIIESFSLNGSEINILAAPYGFNYSAKANLLTYNWSVNSIDQSNLTKNQSIILKTAGESDGSSNVSIDVRNEKEILQGARSSLKINFKKKVANEDTTKL